MSPPSCVPEDSSALPWALDTVYYDPDKQPNFLSFNLLGYIWSLKWAKLSSLTSAPASTTPLQDLLPPLPPMLFLYVPCPDFKRLFLCHLACVHQEDRRLSLASQVTSQERACKCTSLLSSSHSGRLATVARFYLRGAVILLLRA